MYSAFSLRREEARRRITVLNFGGARSITRKYFGKAVNYYARNDPILLVNRRAALLMRQVSVYVDVQSLYMAPSPISSSS
jgi:hypothetical protein